MLIQERPWFADMANFKAVGVLPDDFTWHQKKKFLYDAKQFIWDDPFLFKLGADNLLRRCVTVEEAAGILWHCHNSPYGGHFNGDRTTAKVLQSGFCWPPCSRMLMLMPRAVINAKGLEASREGMKCHRPSWK